MYLLGFRHSERNDRIFMRLRNVPRAAGIIAQSDYVIKEPCTKKGKWNEVFGNNNPIHIEIGMGKGQFLTKLALLNPKINYIGIEKMDSVLFRAVEKMDAMEEKPGNLFFVQFDAEKIPDLFEKDEVEKIYLNFSDPWPKLRHAHRRLTSDRFLARYAQFLKKDGIIEFKTDNTGLFDYSLQSIKEAGWELTLVEYDLHNSKYVEGNVMTEYEEKFSQKGNPIHKAVFKQGNGEK